MAGFIGSPAMNLFQVPIDGENVVIGGERLAIPGGVLSKAHGDKVTLASAPRTWSWSPTAPAAWR